MTTATARPEPDDAPAASAFCLICDANITFQGDRPPHWCHDDYPERDSQHVARPKGPGRLVRCPMSYGPEVAGEPTIIGCGITWIGTADFEGLFDCPGCGMWFNPDKPDNIGEQPPAAAQPVRCAMRGNEKGGDYMPAAQATRLRIFTEPTTPDAEGRDVQWSIDGANDEGDYTEAIWSFDSFDEAVGGLREFAATYMPQLLAGGRLTDQEFGRDPHVDDCRCLFGQPDPACVTYREGLA